MNCENFQTLYYTKIMKKYELTSEGIKYAGSKNRLIEDILNLIPGNCKTALDGFSGTTRVSQVLAKNGFNVISNDLSEWSYVFGNCYLKHDKDRRYYQDILDHLNHLKGQHGWFTENYGGVSNNGSAIQSDGTKRMFQIHNSMKLDSIRNEIDLLCLDEVTKSVVLTSLILALDSVDNSLGHHTSYLKTWSDRSFREMKLVLPQLFDVNPYKHVVIKDDVLNFTGEVDVAYFDPPYGSNNVKMPSSRVRYESYYNIWKSIILNDQPVLFGKSNRRIDSSDKVYNNPFEDFRTLDNGLYVVVDQIRKLMSSVNSKYILLSFSTNNGILHNQLLDVIMSTCKLLKTVEIDYKKHPMGLMTSTNEWSNSTETKELLFLMEK